MQPYLPIAISTIALSLLSLCIAAVALYNSHYRRKVEVVVTLVRAWAQNPGHSRFTSSRTRDDVGVTICVTNCGNTPIVVWSLNAFAGDIGQPRQWHYTDDDFIPIGVKPGDTAIATFNLETNADFSLPSVRDNTNWIDILFEVSLRDFRAYEASIQAGTLRVNSITTDGVYTGGAVRAQKWKVKKREFRKPKFILLNGKFSR